MIGLSVSTFGQLRPPNGALIKVVPFQKFPADSYDVRSRPKYKVPSLRPYTSMVRPTSKHSLRRQSKYIQVRPGFRESSQKAKVPIIPKRRSLPKRPTDQDEEWPNPNYWDWPNRPLKVVTPPKKRFH
ncbi:hypothetical protein HOH87_01075 [bacterium]|jgi:hypothetical protein|nr:hypothetical protein [bacterium]